MQIYESVYQQLSSSLTGLNMSLLVFMLRLSAERETQAVNPCLNASPHTR